VGVLRHVLGVSSSLIAVVLDGACRSLRVVFSTRFKKVVFVVLDNLVAVLRVYRLANRCAKELDVSHTLPVTVRRQNVCASRGRYAAYATVGRCPWGLSGET
jgi:hypothetical protein